MYVVVFTFDNLGQDGHVETVGTFLQKREAEEWGLNCLHHKFEDDEDRPTMQVVKLELPGIYWPE